MTRPLALLPAFKAGFGPLNPATNRSRTFVDCQRRMKATVRHAQLKHLRRQRLFQLARQAAMSPVLPRLHVLIVPGLDR